MVGYDQPGVREKVSRSRFSASGRGEAGKDEERQRGGEGQENEDGDRVKVALARPVAAALLGSRRRLETLLHREVSGNEC